MPAANRLSAAGVPAQALHTGLGAVALHSFAFLSTVLLARGLGPEEQGRFQFLISLAVFLTMLATLGIDEGIAYLLPKYEVTDAGKVAGLIRYAFALTVAIGVLIGVLFYLTAAGVERILRVPGFAPHLRYLVVLLPALMVLSIALAVLRGLGRSDWRAYIYYYVVSLLFLVGLLAAYRSGLTSAEAYAARIVSFFVGAMLAAYLIVRKSHTAQTRLAMSDIRAVHSLAGWMIFVGVFQYAVEQPLLDLVFVGRYDTPEMLGIYAVAAKIGAVAATGTIAINVVMVPVFSRASAGEDRAGLRADYLRGSRWMRLSAIGLGAAILLFHRPVLLIFGASYDRGSLLVEMFALAHVGAALCGVNAPLLVACGYARVEFYLTGAAFFLFLLLGVLLGRAHGATGVAAASVATVLTLAVARRVAAASNIPAVFARAPVHVA